MKTGIIIPCYNEAKRLNINTFISFVKSHDDYILCFVNDGSKDNTLKVLQDIQDEFPTSVIIIDVKKNKGKASAVRVGARYLFNRKDVDYIGFIDADLSTNFNDFKRLVKTLHTNNELSFVYGSRGNGKRNGKGQIDRDFFRKLFSKIVKFLVFLILGLPIEDTQCGAKVFRRNIVPVAYDNVFLTRWLFDVEIFIRLKKYFGSKDIMNRIYEQPLNRWVHVDDSKLGMKDAILIPYKLINIWFSYTLKQYFNSKPQTHKIITIDDFTIISSLNPSEPVAA